MTKEGESLILKKSSTEIRFDNKIANKYGKGLILTTKFYKSANDAALLTPEKQNPGGKAATQQEGTKINKKGNTTTKQIKMRKNHANEIHV